MSEYKAWSYGRTYGPVSMPTWQKRDSEIVVVLCDCPCFQVRPEDGFSLCSRGERLV